MIKLNDKMLGEFRAYLIERECSAATVRKYLHDIKELGAYCGGRVKDKTTLISFKEHLREDGYAPSSINSMLAAINRFLDFAGCPLWKLRFLKVQRNIFSTKEQELTQQDYEKLLKAARSEGDERLEMLVQTICATGIRVSGVRAVTVESLKAGQAEIHLKGKIRVILLPRKLCRMLKRYCKKRGILRGPVFVTRTGRPMDRSNIWKSMKRLAAQAGIPAEKVYPHNLRHLFARTYYKIYKDMPRKRSS